ncbi:MAG: hypothetical protein OQK05_14110 [Pseudopelagicola sp.]|nr:hypothetical protein [Pseudopelagicola sp.]
MTQYTTDEARELSERLNPGMEKALTEGYGHLLPQVAEGVVDFVCGRQYARNGLSLQGGFPAAINALNAALEYLKPREAKTDMTSTENKRAPCFSCPGAIL